MWKRKERPLGGRIGFLAILRSDWDLIRGFAFCDGAGQRFHCGSCGANLALRRITRPGISGVAGRETLPRLAATNWTPSRGEVAPFCEDHFC
jgi:hypothetical protein